MSTSTELANPNVGMDNFITSLKEAGMEEAIESAKSHATDTISAPEPQKKEAAQVPAKPEQVKENSKENPEPEEKKWPRTAKDWEAYKKADKERLDALQKERDDIKAERDRVKSEIEQLKKTGPSPELESLKKEKAELDKQLRLVSVQNHPKFKDYFENKIGAQIELAKRIVGTEREKQITDLLLSPDSPIRDRQIEELSESLNSLQQGRLAGVLNNLTLIQAERESEITKARENYDQLQKQQKDAIEKQQQDFKHLFESTIKQITDQQNGNPAFQKRDGDDSWNSEVDQRIESAKSLLFGNPNPEIITKAALAASAYPAVLKQLQSSIKDIQDLKTQIQQLQSAAPKIESKSKEITQTSSKPSPQSKPGKTDPMSAIGNWLTLINQSTE